MQAAKNIFQNFYAVKLFFWKNSPLSVNFGTAFALYVGRDQKDPGLFEKIEVHFPVSTVLVKWYLPEKFIPQIISGMECCMRFQQTQGTENSRRCRIRYSPCRLLQNNGVLKSVSTTRQVSGEFSVLDFRQISTSPAPGNQTPAARFWIIYG